MINKGTKALGETQQKKHVIPEGTNSASNASKEFDLSGICLIGYRLQDTGQKSKTRKLVLIFIFSGMTIVLL